MNFQMEYMQKLSETDPQAAQELFNLNMPAMIAEAEKNQNDKKKQSKNKKNKGKGRRGLGE